MFSVSFTSFRSGNTAHLQQADLLLKPWNLHGFNSAYFLSDDWKILLKIGIDMELGSINEGVRIENKFKIKSAYLFYYLNMLFQFWTFLELISPTTGT